jgi:hypothetical protein
MRASMSLLALLVLAACGSSTTTASPAPAPPADPDAGADAGSGACDVFATTAFPIDAAGPDSQIHTIGAAAGDRVFVAYNRPKTSSKNFDVFLTAVRCDGTSTFDPVRVSEDDDNDVDPSIAVQGDTVLVAWAGDASGMDPNLRLRTRLFDREGTARGPARLFTGPRKGLANTKNNVWQGSATPLGDGFALTGAWGIDEAPAFQTFGARLDAEGAPSGDAFDLGFDAGTTQTLVDVSSGGGGAWAAWLVEPNTSEGQSVATATFGTSGALTRGPTLDKATAPSVATLASTAWVAAQRGTKDVVLQRLDPPGPAIVMAGKGALPALALSTSGGAFAAYRDAAGGRTIVVTRFDGAGAVVGETDLAITDASPYPLRLVRIADDVYFLAYQYGKGTALRAMGRFFDFRG